MNRLEEIRARAEAATPGPWSIALGSGHHVMTAVVARQGEDATLVCDCLPDWAFTDDCAAEDHRANMRFIQYAREDIPALLAAVEAAMAVADNAEWGEVDMQGEFYFVRPEVMEALRAALAPLREPE